MIEFPTVRKTLTSVLPEEAGWQKKPLVQVDFDDLVKSTELLKRLFPTWVFMVCKVKPYEFHYVSDNCQHILGYPATYLQRLAPEQYFTLIHPEDAKVVRMCLAYVHQWNTQTPALDCNEYRFVYHYRLKNSRQQYVYVLDEKHALQNQYGQHLHFTIVKNVTQLQPFTHAKVEVYKLINGGFRKIDEYVPRTGPVQTITPREKEILQCLQEGLTSKQIAEKLSVSVFTVRNHRNNIFRKSQALNVVQLLKHAKTSGWI